MGGINYDALCWGLAIVLGILFAVAWLGMSGGPHYTAGRPPTNPPGWKNIKRRK